jgi:hypothetical protein
MRRRRKISFSDFLALILIGSVLPYAFWTLCQSL